MTLMLQNVVKSGTATDITLDEVIECAGKTGTTQNKCDSWYIGYTPEYIMGVWFGYEYPKPLPSNLSNPSARIWDILMSRIYENTDYGRIVTASIPWKYLNINNPKKEMTLGLHFSFLNNNGTGLLDNVHWPAPAPDGRMENLDDYGTIYLM